jgi:putative ABC transport system permease protein
MSQLRHDVRLALRAFRAARGPVSLAIITLALGIGVTSAVFSILDAVVLRPVPYRDGDRLVHIWNFETKSQVSHPRFPAPLLAEWRRQSDLFERVEAFDVTSSIYDGPAGAEMITGVTVTPGLLDMLGVVPLRGRLFGDADGRDGTDDLLLVSESFWRQTLAGDPDVVGSALTLNQRQHVIVGVMPAGFRFPNESASFWTPYHVDTPPARAEAPRLEAFAKLRADVPMDVAATRVKERGQALNVATGGPADRSAMLQPAGSLVDRRMRISLLVLGGAVLFLLLIVCANLANLSLARTMARARDFAVRSSLGATRRDLIRETLVEHGLIGAAGVAAGLVVAAGVLLMAIDTLPAGFRLSTMNAIDLDARALAFTALAGLVTVLLFGLPPAWLASRSAVTDVLKRESRSSAGSPAARRLRNGLVVVEVALAIVLLVGAALMARSLVKLQSVDRGFDATGLIAMRIGLPRAGYADVYARDAFSDRLVTRLSRLPGVSAVTVGGVPPDSSMISFGKLEAEDRPGDLSEELVVPVYQVWPNYFDAVGIALREGRPFSEDESLQSVIVSESLARRFWPSGAAVGKRVRFEGSAAWRTIVGVAAEVRQMDLDDETGSFEMYYPVKRPAGLPQPQLFGSGAIATYRTFVIRADDVHATMLRLRPALHEEDARVVIWRVDQVEQLFADAVARPRLVLLMMLVFSGLGLVLAAAGIYGVLSYSVVQRRREIGIRLALGARPHAVGGLIVRNGLAMTGVGLAVGLALAFALTGVMRSLLYEVEPTDPLSVIGVAALLVAVAAIASWWPARRAMKLDPLVLLREE